MPSPFDDFTALALGIARETVRVRLAEFAQTPQGKVVREAGRRMIAIKKEGRDPTMREVAEFFDQRPLLPPLKTRPAPSHEPAISHSRLDSDRALAAD